VRKQVSKRDAVTLLDNQKCIRDHCRHCCCWELAAQ